ncbi:hypothetical protein [Micromonospora sp. RP3T]|uniref:hypothetical protein n=1 Tax=Micromonospora sp. RP3T TaxID=2135446 RepID=UPI003D727B3C
MSAPDRACPDYPNECVHPWAHARTCAEVKATQTEAPAAATARRALAELVDHVAARPQTPTADGLPTPDGEAEFAAVWAAGVAAVTGVMGRQTWRHRVERDLLNAYAQSDPAALRTALLSVAGTLVSWVADLDTRPPDGER